MNQLVEDEFDVDDPVFKELTQLHQIQMNKKLRQKEPLPIDRITAEAMQSHKSLDELNVDNSDSDSSDVSGGDYSGDGNYSDGDYSGGDGEVDGDYLDDR